MEVVMAYLSSKFQCGWQCNECDNSVELRLVLSAHFLRKIEINIFHKVKLVRYFVRNKVCLNSSAEDDR